MRPFKVKFNLGDDEYLTSLRLVAGSILSARGADLDDLDDFKVCVTESVLLFKNCGYEEVEVAFIAGDSVVCEVCGVGGEPHAGDNDLSLALIPALVESFDIVVKDEIVEKVTLKV